MKFVNLGKNFRGENHMLSFADTEARKYGKQPGLGTQLAHAVNNAYYFKVSFVK